MKETIEKLLQPVSPDQPCGPDLSNDPSFDALENLLKGKPEVEIGSVLKPAEPPDWNELRKQSAEYLGKSKHLRVATMFCGSLLKTGGVEGFRDGLQFIHGLLEQRWAAFYPLLDPEDNNDPEMRLNILRALTLERGALAAGWLTIVDSLYAAEVCRPRGMAPVTFDQVLSIKQNPPDGSSVSKLGAAIRSAGGEVLAARHQALKESLEAVEGMDQFLTSTLGAGKTISFEILENALKETLGLIAPYIAGGEGEVGEAGAAATTEVGGDGSTSGGAARISVRGPVRSREDVVKVLDSICAYYDQIEPGSPVPYLLRRAQKMVKMNFIEAIQELNIATVDALRPSMGSTVDGDGQSAAPAEAPPADTPSE